MAREVADHTKYLSSAMYNLIKVEDKEMADIKFKQNKNYNRWVCQL